MEIPRFYNTQLIKGEKGFNTCLKFGEDWELYNRIRTKHITIGKTNSEIKHYEETSLSAILKKAYSYGKNYSVLRKKSKGTIHRYILPSKLKTIIFLFSNPVLGFSYFILRLLKGFFFLVGYLSSL